MSCKLRRFLLVLVISAAANAAAVAAPREEARLLEATQVLEETAAMPDQQIPDALLRRAQGIAVLPTVVKAAFLIGGRGGKGVLTIRDAQGRWTNPAFIRLAGGSFGLQWGVQTADIVLVFTTRRGIEGLTGGKVTLGGDASVAVGPVGRQVSGATDISFTAEVYSYSRAKGLYAGIAIDGTVLTIDNGANASFYERPGVLASDIFSGRAPAAPENAKRLLDAVRRLAPSGEAAPAAAASSQARPVAPPAPPPPDGRALESGGATAYPLQQTPPPKR